MFRALRKQLILIGASTLLAGFSLVSIVYFTNPYASSVLTLIVFYFSLFLVSIGILTVLGLFARSLYQRGLYITNLIYSSRQAFLASLLLIFSLFLLSKNLLYWWVELSLILFLLSIEVFFNMRV